MQAPFLLGFKEGWDYFLNINLFWLSSFLAIIFLLLCFVKRRLLIQESGVLILADLCSQTQLILYIQSDYMKEEIVFVINPISGGKSKNKLKQWIQEEIDLERYDPHCVFTERPGHACELTAEAMQRGVRKIVAVGGDGTVNEVARMMVGTTAILGIIPFGSGNGLARHMGIPVDPKEAIQRLNACEIRINDAGKVNGKYFFCTSGVGFDAHIGKIFASLKGRGFMGYIKAVVKEFSTYQSQMYQLVQGDAPHQHQAFLITFANANQYGNDAQIAPLANIQDGKLDVCIVRPFPIYAAPGLALRIFSKSAHRSGYMTTFQTSKIELKRSSGGPIHLDGEPYEAENTLVVEVVPNAIQIMA